MDDAADWELVAVTAATDCCICAVDAGAVDEVEEEDEEEPLDEEAEAGWVAVSLPAVAAAVGGSSLPRLSLWKKDDIQPA